MPLIEVSHLKKEFKRNIMEKGLKGAVKNLIHAEYETKTAVDDISFQVEEQEAIGYIGANGSGKSTTIKMLSGILTPTSGSIHVGGLIPYRDRIRNNYQIGVIFGQRSQLWWDVPVIESYRLIQKLYEVEQSRFDKNLRACMETLEIEDLLKISPRQMSLGQKMRCEIGSVLLYDPRIVYLDEPTIGLDASAKDNIRQFIRHMNESKRTTVFLTSHDYQDIEGICGRVMILEQGKIVWDGSKQEIKERFTETKTMKLYVESLPVALLHVFDNNPAVSLRAAAGNCIEVDYLVKEISPAAVIAQVGIVAEIKDIELNEISIEEIVKKYFFHMN